VSKTLFKVCFHHYHRLAALASAIPHLEQPL
jgi:hypothetical protein